MERGKLPIGRGTRYATTKGLFMTIRRTLALCVFTAGLAACGTPTVTNTPDDIAAQESAISAPSDSPTVGAGPQTAKVGDIITLAGSNDVKVAIKVDKVFPRAQPADDFISAGEDREFYGVSLVLKNVGQAAYNDSPANGAYVIDDEGQQFGTIIADIKGGVSLNSTTIAPGDVRKGVIVFAVQKGANIKKIQLALDSGFADQKGEWTVE